MFTFEYMFMYLATFISLLSTLFYIRFYKIKNYWKKKNVPFVKPFPFFGTEMNVMLFRLSLGEQQKKTYEAFPDEKIVGIFRGRHPALVIRDPELLKLILAKDFYYFNSRGTPQDERNVLLSNLFHTEGDKWRVFRKNLTPLFTSSKMKNMFYLMAEQSEHFEKYIAARVKKNPELEIRDLMSRLSLDIIGSCAFGLELNSMTEDDNMFRKMGIKIFELTYFKSLKFFIMILFPKIRELFNIRIVDPSIEKFFIDLVKKITESREKNISNRHDFIDLMVELRKKGHITGEKIVSLVKETAETVSIKVDDGIMAAQSFIFFAAGFETSSTTMSFALHELALNSSIQKHAQKEIDEILKKCNGKLTYEAVSEMNYLEMIVNETLRKYPVLGAITRKCVEDYKIPDTDIIIEKGTQIYIPALAIHHDPQYYPDPEKFIPERFLPEEKQKRSQYTFLPFGEGMRICIGLRFGKLQTMVGLIALLKSFSVEPSSKTDRTIQIDPRSFVITAKRGINLRIVPRNNNS